MNECVMAVCGWKNSGKTTLIEGLVHVLKGWGLTVAVVKHDTHGIDLDHPGKDSFRFFEVGADVALTGPGEELIRCRRDEKGRMDDLLAAMSPRYDLILVEGHKETPLRKIWLYKGEKPDRPEGVEEVLLELSQASDRVKEVSALLREWLPLQWRRQPIYGCLLIGGKSRRMGRPKHLMGSGTTTWIEETARILAPRVKEVVIAGEGALPESLASNKRLTDVPGVKGPLSGILSAMRWNPDASWILAACDLPDVTPEALDWLLDQREPGTWAVMPAVREGPTAVESLLAYYDSRAAPLLESRARTGKFSIYPLVAHPKIKMIQVPMELAGAWRNVNTPEDLG